ncbi:MAG: hypothetical protein KAW16_04270 [candidate division Zixibacteria bacterium]|nr:hypothetical protein [candidate division Zixibacteria bacterium]
MEPIEYLYLLILGIFCVSFTSVVYRNVYKKGMKAADRYKLYKVRDDLVFLVAKGTIDEEDFIFKIFYEWTNTYIQHIHRFTLKEINKAMEEARENGYLKEINEFQAKIERELANKENEVKEVTQEFFWTMCEILVRNSFTIRLLVRYRFTRFVQAIVKNGRILQSLLRAQESGYRNYQMHDQIYNSLAKVNC